MLIFETLFNKKEAINVLFMCVVYVLSETFCHWYTVNVPKAKIHIYIFGSLLAYTSSDNDISCQCTCIYIYYLKKIA